MATITFRRNQVPVISSSFSVVHEPAHGTLRLEGSSLSRTWTPGLEPESSCQETGKSLESRVELALGPLSELTRADLSRQET